MRATNTNPAAMDVVWSWDVIGIRFIKKILHIALVAQLKINLIFYLEPVMS